MSGTLQYREEGSGRPLLFLHGFLGAGSDWSGVIERLRSSYRCIAVDLPGHGGSINLPNPSDYGMSGTVTLLNDLLTRLELTDCLLVGYSMGGRVGMHLLSQGTPAVAGAVFEGASPGIENQDKRRMRLESDERWAEKLDRGDLDLFLDTWYAQDLFASLRADPERLRSVKERRLRNDPDELARSLRGLGVGIQAPLWDDLPAWDRPTLAVAGALDTRYAGVGTRMAGVSDAIEVVIIPASGHNIHLEQPDVFATVLDGFAARS